MKNAMLQEEMGVFTRNRRHRTWKKVVGALICIVVFCTTYALILPAITQATAPLMGDFAYISDLGMGSTDQDKTGGIMDGSIPWDKDDSDGCDTGNRNRRVRTFDTIKYDFYYTTKLQDNDSTDHYDSARVYFEFLLPVEKSQAYFSEDDMAWLKQDGVSYRYEKTSVTINGASYQVLHGSFMNVQEGSDVTAASVSRDVVVRVMNMKNNSIIQPVFSVWIEYNDVGVKYDENNIPINIAYENGHRCSEHQKNEVKSLKPEEVTVTCTPRYAISLKRGETSTTSWGGNFDFGTGNDLALDKEEEIWNGRISAYGIRLMVQGVDKEHGLRGCAFPEQGDILEFDISLVTAWQDLNGGAWNYMTQEFKPRVWSAEEFVNHEEQKDGRVVSATRLPAYAAPLNQGDDPSRTCKDGGTWEFENKEFLWDDKNHRVIHVTVSGYTFDPEHLPHTYERGAENDTEFYNPSEIGNQFWNVQNAVFSTGEMWVVTPFYNEPGSDADHYITTVKETAGATMWQSIFAWNIAVKDNNNQSKFNEDGELDHLDCAITLQPPGQFNTFVAMLQPFGEWNAPLTAGGFQGENELKDYATPGSYADLEAWLFHDEAEGDDVGVAYNLMTKFDNAFFEPVKDTEMEKAGFKLDIEKTSISGGKFGYVHHTWLPWPEYTNVPGYQKGGQYDAWEPKMLYGTTQNKKGWDHKGLKPDGAGYDEEMMKATPDDLIWYNTLEELKADGAECVAVLMEYRNVSNNSANNSSTMNHLHMSVHGRIKETAETGYVYAVTNYVTAWTKEDVKEYVRDYNGDGKINSLDYLVYTHQDFPSYSPSAGNKMDSNSFCKPTYERSWNRWSNVNEEYLNGENGYGTVRKSYLKENGTFIAGSGGYYYTDNVYVVGYKSEIGIQVAQTGSDGKSKNTYSMDYSERVVDFKVSPRLVRSATDMGAGGETNTCYADVTLTATLPEGLEYYSGTAVWGGSYQQNDAWKEPGTILGGQPLETTVMENPDGTVTLTWVLKHVSLRKATEDLPPVYFSCKIGDSSDPKNDVENGETLKIQADIYSTMDPGVIHDTANNNQANTSIQISKNTALTITKTTDKPLVDISDPMGFTLKVYNSSESSYKGWIADILPQNGVGYSHYSGSLRVEMFRIVSDINLDGVKFYYTTDSEVGTTVDVSRLDTSSWKEFTLDKDRAWCPGKQTEPITAIAYQYDIPGKALIEMHIDLSLPSGQPGDVIHNKLLLNTLLTSDRSQIVSRTLEGLAWMDVNADGIQNEEDGSRINDLVVTLMKLKQGTIFRTRQDIGDANLTFLKDTTYQGLLADDITQIRVVADGPVGNLIKLYYAAGDAEDLSEENSISWQISQGTSEYVFDLKGKWTGEIHQLRLDPFEGVNLQGTIESVTFVLKDGSIRWFDLTEPGNYKKYLGAYQCVYIGNYQADWNNEADYYLCAEIKTGQQINVRVGGMDAVTAYEEGRYKFIDLPAGIYAVKFTDGDGEKISQLIASPSNRKGVDDTIDSDGIPFYSADKRRLEKTFIPGIYLPTVEKMQGVFCESKYHDSGFYERGYELPETGGVSALPYTISGTVLLGGTLSYLLLRRKKRKGGCTFL